MNCKRLIALVGILSIFQLIHVVAIIHAEEKLPNMTMVYMTADGLPNADIYFLEATIAAFAEKIELVAASQIDPATIQQSDVIVFVGNEPGNVPEPLHQVIRQFTGKILAFGHNVEQLQPYDDWHFLGPEYIQSLDEESMGTTVPITHVLPPTDTAIISTGSTLNEEIPFILKKGRLSYIGATAFGAVEKYTLSRSLYALLDQEPPTVHQAYIRLEDISPVSDPKLVKETGDYLADRGIPFYMAVIPVYVNTETGDQIFFKQNKELVEVMKHLQDRGGMVISHGYTHSYRYEETGEGFEFWDDKLNQKITTEQTNELPPPLKSRLSFASEELYAAYTKEVDRIEKTYVERKLSKSIEHLSTIGLYPISFEAPHYTMSSDGYRIASNYFTSIFGQVQLSDSDWEIMDAPLFVSRPAILSGMILYPETIGYIDPDLLDPFRNMEIAIERLTTVPGSMIGGFYHPYLGMEYLPRMIQLIESVPNMEWLDLAKTEQISQTNRVTIRQMADEPLQVTSTITRVDRLMEQLEGRPFDLALWILALVVTLFLIAFSTYVVGLRARLRKRLFGEREFIG